MAALLSEKWLSAFRDPAHEFGVMPFWFWNDDLDEAEIVRQLGDFEAHGVYGIVFQPRVGLPRDIGWVSPRLLHFMRVAIDECKRRNMHVVLYDEGMYPSGSSSGQVVAENPDYQCRCLARVELADGVEPQLEPGQNLVAIVERQNGQRVAFVDRKYDGCIRGLHYLDHDGPRLPDGGNPPQDEPPSTDLLNPDAVATFIRLVYEKFAEHFHDEFGKTILAVFTDEPNPIGRRRESQPVQFGTTGILHHVSAFLGYDFTPHLPALWYDDEPDAQRYRTDYKRAVNDRFDQTYYRQLSSWCRDHGLPLTGHPSQPDDIGSLRYFDIPGQDVVWRELLAGNDSGVEGGPSTQAKCTSSAMIHFARRRNGNEYCGNYLHGTTWQEIKWTTDWLLVRGVNLLIPHAFYYSLRGPRIDERPTDVGPNSPWWDRYKPYADYCRRMCWLNTDCHHVCRVAVLGQPDFLPWRAAKVCFQHQRDFNYVEMRHLWEDAEVNEHGIAMADMHYDVLVIDDVGRIRDEAQPGLEALGRGGRLVYFSPDQPGQLIEAIDAIAPVDLRADPAQPDLRYRHTVKDGRHFYLLANEGLETISFQVQTSVSGAAAWLDPDDATLTSLDGPVHADIEPYTIKILCIDPSS